jgi:hypothetical protein
MKLAEIQIGERYAVSILPKQIENAQPGLLGSESLGAELVLSRARRFWSGYEALVVGIEANERGRKVVRVEFTAYSLRRFEKTEDNYDGTRTKWTGYVFDENDNMVEEEEIYEAFIQPSQVHATWEDATVERAMSRFESTLKYHPERVFGEEQS